MSTSTGDLPELWADSSAEDRIEMAKACSMSSFPLCAHFLDLADSSDLDEIATAAGLISVWVVCVDEAGMRFSSPGIAAISNPYGFKPRKMRCIDLQKAA